MTPGDPGAIDPNTGFVVPPSDSIHYSVVELYYKLKPIYDSQKQKAIDYYNNYTWYNYAVKLLNVAEALNIKVRPPNFEPAPLPPNVDTLTLSSTYQIVIVSAPACPLPKDPDPATQVLQLAPKKNPGDADTWLIVNLTPVGVGSGGLIAPSNANVTYDQVVTFLKGLSLSDITSLFNTIIAYKATVGS